MSTVTELLIAEGIRLKRYTDGDQKAICPKCGGGHSKEHSLSVTIRPDEAVWVCHRAKCGWTGNVREDRDDMRPYRRPSKPAPVKPAFRPDTSGLPAPVAAWFKARGISAETLKRNAITVVKAWMPGPNAEVDCIAFPYTRDGEVVNVKYRDSNKHFRQEKGAEKILFGMDNVPADADTLIWVEGECDVLACNEAGLWNVVSVPDGAPKQVRDETPSPEDDTKFEYVWNSKPFLDRFRRHVLAVDADGPGEALREELARRLGKERCWRVQWPDDIDGTTLKDANDTLVGLGVAGLRKAVDAAEAYPIQSLYEVRDFAEDVFRLYRDGRARGLSTGFQNLDELMTIRPGELSVVTGYPSSGKSEFVDAVAVNMAMMHGWRFAVCSFENPPDEHIAKWSEKYIGRPFYDGPTPRMGEHDLRLAVEWVNRHFSVIRAGEESPTIDWVLEKAAVAVLRYGIKGLILDPYNEFEHQRASGVTETEYVSQMLAKVKRFAQGHGVHVWFIAHPKKPPPESYDQPPSLYDISGSANWVNKADMGVSVHRSWEPDGSRSSVAEIHVKKVRFRACGRPGVARLEFLPATGRYKEHCA